MALVDLTKQEVFAIEYIYKLLPVSEIINKNGKKISPNAICSLLDKR